MKVQIKKRLKYSTAAMIAIIAATLCFLMPTKTSAQKKETKFTSVFSSVPTLAAKNCKTDDAYISEGDDFGKICPGSGKYKILLSGSASLINYGAVVPKGDFSVYFFPLENGAAQKFERADLFRQKIAGQIEWRLADGVPFAVIVRTRFFNNTKGAKSAKNSAKAVGDFVFVRGLKGFENLQEDLDAVHTAFNPSEKARKIADEFYEQKNK